MSENKINPGENGCVINQDYELVATDRLLPHPRNVNRGDLVAIGGSIAENGFYGAIVAQKSTGHILAGNHRYEAAKTAGITEVPVTWVDVDDDRALRILLADNRTTRLGHDDQAALAALLQEILDSSETLAGTGFDEAALDELLAEVGVTECEAVGQTDEDAVPEPLSFPVTEPGDLWVLGKHRLLCGDSTSIDAVETLMDGEKADVLFTDPPYNINFKPQRGTHDIILNDDLGDSEFDDFLDAVFACAKAALKENTFAFVWTGWPKLGAFERSLRKFFEIKAFHFWLKNNFGIGYYSRPKHEPFYLCLNGKPPYPEVAPADVWEHAKVTDTLHSCEKPVGLIEQILGTYHRGGTILDLFGGSGSTLLACEKTKRKSRLMELDPKYCDVIIRRFQDFTGKEAVLESDGRTFNEIAAQRQPEAAAA